MFNTLFELVWAAFFSIMKCFKTLLKGGIVFCIAIALFGACERVADRRFDFIEQELSSHPDSAYAQLYRISGQTLQPSSCRARYALLMSMAMDKSYIDVMDDSLAQIAVQYYRNHGDEHHRMLSLYSLGRVQRNAGNNTGAIISFLQAKELAEKLSDYHYLGLASWNIAGLYGECHDEESELQYYMLCRDAFLTNNEEGNVAYAQLGEARTYMTKGMKVVADSVFDRVESFARESHNDVLLSQILKDRALNFNNTKDCNPLEVISLYREADSLGFPPKKTADYGALVLAYGLLSQNDSVAKYIVLAENTAKSTLDSAHYYNFISVLSEHQGDFKVANEQIREAIKYHNRMVFNRENQRIANAISYANKQEATRQTDVAHNRLILILLSLICIVALICVLVLVVINRRYQIREKNRVILEQERKIEEDLANIQEISEQLRGAHVNQSEMAKTINNLMEEKIAIIKQCADAYENVKNNPKENPRDPYRYLDEDPVKKKTDEMRKFLNALEDFRKDDSLFLLLEESVNKWRGNIMQRLRRSCAKETMRKPKFSEDDFRILMLIYAGIPDRSIAFLMDMTCAAVRTRKTRYKERLVQDDIPDGPLFVQEMTGIRPV